MILNHPQMIDLLHLILLRNSQIAAEGDFPMCQDTGTAIVIAKKGQMLYGQMEVMKMHFPKVLKKLTKLII